MSFDQKFASDVLIAGIGMTPVGEHWDISLRELALQSISEARASVPTLKPETLYIANILAPAL